jgi:hypothetical protein
MAEGYEYDTYRDSVSGKLCPVYYKDIHYAYLSLDGVGMEYYGGCSLTLKTELISKRASVFEENGFHFLEKHQVVGSEKIPHGYRATWENRSKLALAKLHYKLSDSTLPSEFPLLLLNGEDCIEVHIYGQIHLKAVEEVSLGVLNNPQKVLLETYRNKLEGIGVNLKQSEVA